MLSMNDHEWSKDIKGYLGLVLSKVHFVLDCTGCCQVLPSPGGCWWEGPMVSLGRWSPGTSSGTFDPCWTSKWLILLSTVQTSQKKKKISVSKLSSSSFYLFRNIVRACSDFPKYLHYLHKSSCLFFDLTCEELLVIPNPSGGDWDWDHPWDHPWEVPTVTELIATLRLNEKNWEILEAIQPQWWPGGLRFFWSPQSWRLVRSFSTSWNSRILSELLYGEFMTWCPTCYWTYQVRLLQIDKTFHWFDGFWCLILQLGVPVTVPQWQHSRPAQIYLPIPMGCIFWALIDLLGNAWAVPAQFLLTWHSHGSLLGESDGLPFSLPRERFGEPPLWIYCRVLGYRQCTSLKGSTERLPVDATVHSG